MENQIDQFEDAVIARDEEINHLAQIRARIGEFKELITKQIERQKRNIESNKKSENEDHPLENLQEPEGEVGDGINLNQALGKP